MEMLPKFYDEGADEKCAKSILVDYIILWEERKLIIYQFTKIAKLVNAA